MSTKVRIPNRVNPSLIDQFSPVETQALVDDGYGYILELIDLIHESMWERVQEDGWTKANDHLFAWLIDRIDLLPENEGEKLRDVMLDRGDSCHPQKESTYNE